ncbi:MAG: hypothetical protein J6L75_03680, partial [Alistipes sp.]|nr:hypothetical protein [Alistipes sp.]
KKRNDSQLPEYTTDHSFRVYYRYVDYADLNLVKFEEVSENYISDNYKYVVGKVSLAELHRVQDELRKRNIFIAAYPND